MRCETDPTSPTPIVLHLTLDEAKVFNHLAWMVEGRGIPNAPIRDALMALRVALPDMYASMDCDPNPDDAIVSLYLHEEIENQFPVGSKVRVYWYDDVYEDGEVMQDDEDSQPLRVEFGDGEYSEFFQYDGTNGDSNGNRIELLD